VDLALAIFAGLPLALLPFYFFPPTGQPLPMLLAGGLAGALFGAAVRLVWELRTSAGSLKDAGAAIGLAFNHGMSAAVTWLHDAMLKWIFSLFLLAFAAAAIFVSREQEKPLFFWVGMVLVFLIGTTGIWVPGLYNRTAPLAGLRHVGQLAFWLSLFAVPFFEQGPAGDLPYTNKPSLRFVVAGLGLVIAGATWFIQKPSILSRGPRPEPKKPSERGFSLVLLLVGLAVTLAGAQAFQRGQLTIDDTKLSETNFLGTTRFDPVDQIQALEIVQPLERVPFYLDQVVYLDHTTRLVPMLYPGNQYHPDDNGMVKAVRKAANLNTQSFPDKHTERWSR
ncbi:MAG TPA: hypothetical protein VK009_14910, partial [Chloroflexota bacterium]|nr:hypothetical protein [Chloroflexota bacterium]